jgi:hypothetical protein
MHVVNKLPEEMIDRNNYQASVLEVLRTIKNVVPSLFLLSSEICPECDSIIFFAIISP